MIEIMFYLIRNFSSRVSVLFIESFYSLLVTVL